MVQKENLIFFSELFTLPSFVVLQHLKDSLRSVSREGCNLKVGG